MISGNVSADRNVHRGNKLPDPKLGIQRMVTLRFAVPVILAAAAVAACFSYFVDPPARVEMIGLSMSDCHRPCSIRQVLTREDR